MEKKIPYRHYLTEDQLPRQWYNLRADMKELPDPLRNPATGEALKEGISGSLSVLDTAKRPGCHHEGLPSLLCMAGNLTRITKEPIPENPTNTMTWSKI